MIGEDQPHTLKSGLKNNQIQVPGSEVQGNPEPAPSPLERPLTPGPGPSPLDPRPDPLPDPAPEPFHAGEVPEPAGDPDGDEVDGDLGSNPPGRRGHRQRH